MEKLSYALGMIIGRNLRSMNISSLDAATFAKAANTIVADEKPEMTMVQAQSIVQEFIEKQEAEAGRAAREEGEKYLAENAKKEGVVVLDSGLQYQVLTPAEGQKPTADDRVRCHYEGRLTNGKVFDSSYRRGEPATFPLRGVIEGWTEGLQLMAVGAKYRFFIPYNLGYGSHGAGNDIPPYAALVFDVELLGINE